MGGFAHQREAGIAQHDPACGTGIVQVGELRARHVLDFRVDLEESELLAPAAIGRVGTGPQPDARHWVDRAPGPIRPDGREEEPHGTGRIIVEPRHPARGSIAKLSAVDRPATEEKAAVPRGIASDRMRAEKAPRAIVLACIAGTVRCAGGEHDRPDAQAEHDWPGQEQAARQERHGEIPERRGPGPQESCREHPGQADGDKLPQGASPRNPR
jgi:hypothetical protein